MLICVLFEDGTNNTVYIETIRLCTILNAIVKTHGPRKPWYTD